MIARITSQYSQKLKQTDKRYRSGNKYPDIQLLHRNAFLNLEDLEAGYDSNVIGKFLETDSALHEAALLLENSLEEPKIQSGDII